MQIVQTLRTRLAEITAELAKLEGAMIALRNEREKVTAVLELIEDDPTFGGKSVEAFAPDAPASPVGRSSRAGGTEPRHYVKRPERLRQVLRFLQPENGDEPQWFSSPEVGAGIGVAQGSARRFLAELRDAGRVETNGKSSNDPRLRYRIVMVVGSKSKSIVWP